MFIYEQFQLPFTKSSVTFDLREIQSPNWCQKVGFFVQNENDDNEHVFIMKINRQRK